MPGTPPRRPDGSHDSEAVGGKGSGKGKGRDGSTGAAPTRFALPLPTASDLAGLMSTGGKAVPAASGLASADSQQAQWTSDARAASGSASAAGYVPGSSTFRSAGPSASSSAAQINEHEVNAFLRGSAVGQRAQREEEEGIREDLEEGRRLLRSPELLVGPYAQAEALDPALHASVRTASKVSMMESAWLSSVYSTTDSRPTNQDELQSSWDRSANARSQRHSPSKADAVPSFMDALAAEEALEAPQAAAAPFVPPAHGVQALPPGLTDTWRPPTPSRAGELTLEQLEMHRQVAAAQDDELAHLPPLASKADASQNAVGSRAAEGVAPPKDDEKARSGVYALSPEDALQAIWNGPAEGERARQSLTSGGEGDALAGNSSGIERGQEVVAQVRTWLGRGTYVDDVYGLPPLLLQTFQEATAETQDTRAEAMRAQAIARLEALTRHLTLSDNALSAHADKSAAAEDWLRRN